MARESGTFSRTLRKGALRYLQSGALGRALCFETIGQILRIQPMKPQFLALVFLFSAGCADGPTHTYYNPAIVDGPRFKGPVTISQVKDLDSEVKKCLDQGYVIIGRTIYGGQYPKTVELTAQGLDPVPYAVPVLTAFANLCRKSEA